MLFKSKKSYCRESTLDAANKARARGKKKKAIAQYMKVLDADPADHVVHGKLAPLLAESKRYEDSWKSFQSAAKGYIDNGFYDKAIGVYSQAARLMPKNLDIWDALAELQVERGLKADAVHTLFTAHRYFKSKTLRDKAIALLRKGFGIAPWHYEITYELARLLAKSGDKEEALRLYDGLADRSRGLHLRRIRSAILKLSPTPLAAWKWLRVVFSGA